MGAQKRNLFWGSAGCQPACLGSLPRHVSGFTHGEENISSPNVAGKLPATAGWQPALPRHFKSRVRKVSAPYLRRLHPAAQHFGHTPGLGDAAPGGVRLTRVENFADRADPVFVHAFGKAL